MSNRAKNFTLTDDVEAILDELNDIAMQDYRESDVQVGPGQWPFRSAIVRKALRIAAPAIRSGLEEEGIEFLL